jgi:hypothetical protein
VTKYLRETIYERKDLFWLLVSIHDWSDPLFLGLDEAEHHGRRVWQNKVAHSMVSRNQRETEEGTWDKI